MHTREPECIQPRCPPRPFCREGAPAFRRGEGFLPSSGWEESPGFSRGEDVKRSSDPFRRAPRGVRDAVEPHARTLQHCEVLPAVLYACMHLYASGDAYKKGLEKARKPLYIKGKTEFLSLVCIVCINIRGFLPFSRIPYKGMMHTMHTRPRTIPGTLEPSRNGKRRCMHPRMHTDAYRPAGMHTRPRIGDRRDRGRIPSHATARTVGDET
ncbi:hypothetical protein SAMN04489748_0983 [Bifidobacterium longum]|uniref:Uncharacterized protein n=1 Tax=Bifidobacterium longum TaxID=216816 RepID=A0AA45V6J2_BIFLN|nr:hypothetical protein SAMN04489748_0983 [Bifidobacterium longum]VEG79381.1 Uncharacterised protein [Bifidobacterium longum]